MGLDIHLSTDKDKEIRTPEYFRDTTGYFRKHSLSRTFCNLMCRPNVIDGEPELDQIGRITNVDISPIHDMEKYWDDSNIESQLSFAKTEEDRQGILQRIQSDKSKVENNIDNVLNTINNLIERLSKIHNLPSLLTDNGFDTLDNESYFADFTIDKGQGYIGNNFGHDLRNFKCFLEYAKEKGATTVYFDYG